MRKRVITSFRIVFITRDLSRVPLVIILTIISFLEILIQIRICFLERSLVRIMSILLSLFLIICFLVTIIFLLKSILLLIILILLIFEIVPQFNSTHYRSLGFNLMLRIQITNLRFV